MGCRPISSAGWRGAWNPRWRAGHSGRDDLNWGDFVGGLTGIYREPSCGAWPEAKGPPPGPEGTANLQLGWRQSDQRGRWGVQPSLWRPGEGCGGMAFDGVMEGGAGDELPHAI